MLLDMFCLGVMNICIISIWCNLVNNIDSDGSKVLQDERNIEEEEKLEIIQETTDGKSKLDDK